MKPATRQRIVQKALELGYSKLHFDLHPSIELNVSREASTTWSGSAHDLAYGSAKQSANRLTHGFASEAAQTAKTASKNNYLVSLITHSDYMGNHFWSPFIKGLNLSLKEAGYTLAMTLVDMEDESELRLPQLFMQQPPAGVVTIGPFLRQYYERIAATSIPALFVDTYADFDMHLLKCDTLLVDNKRSTTELTRHLIAQGHRDIGFVGDIGSCLSYAERWQGYVQAMREFGLPVRSEQCITNMLPRHYYMEAELEGAFARMANKPSAFVCANDTIALDMKRIARRAGLRVPEDIALTGFDNLAESATAHPPLTTVHIPKEQMGMRAGEQIAWRMAHPERSQELIRVAVQPIWRQSSTYQRQ
ncbi:substrate-binding domain-containing protein [Paenibacillus sp. 481]|nr:substrate-binding domain-containing protein [Paenibacillus sp. 481]